jgi:hypothetical protein
LAAYQAPWRKSSPQRVFTARPGRTSFQAVIGGATTELGEVAFAEARKVARLRTSVLLASSSLLNREKLARLIDLQCAVRTKRRPNINIGCIPPATHPGNPFGEQCPPNHTAMRREVV